MTNTSTTKPDTNEVKSPPSSPPIATPKQKLSLSDSEDVSSTPNDMGTPSVSTVMDTSFNLKNGNGWGKGRVKLIVNIVWNTVIILVVWG